MVICFVIGFFVLIYAVLWYLYFRSRKKELAENDMLSRSLRETMFASGYFISGIKDKTKDQEILSFVSMIGRWMLRFPCGKDISEKVRKDAQFEALREYRIRYNSKEFSFMSDKDDMYFDAFLRFWYEGKILPSLMIAFCSRLSEVPDVGVSEIVKNIMVDTHNDDLKNELENIHGKKSAEVSQNKELKKAIEDE